MDLLIDTNVAVDICTKRQPFFRDAHLALEKCLGHGSRLWLYVGSVQTLELATINELRLRQAETGTAITDSQLQCQAHDLLKEFVADKHWLAALAGEGPVFDCQDIEDEQLIRALGRFAPGSIKLLTRDEQLCQRFPGLAITPDHYLAEPLLRKAIDFVDLKIQQDSIRPRLEENIHRVLHHGHYIMGPEVVQLEEKLAAYVGVEHCVSASSGTDTLLIAMMALGIGPGDEVITTPFTFIATGEMIALLGAIPVFVDIDPRTYNIDPTKINAAITSKTKAIMPVSLYGQCADMDAINSVAEKHRLPVIEDAAQSFGASYKGRKSCGLSTVGSTSFFPSKPLGAYGDGGALFTNDGKLAKAMREIRAHGQDRRYHHPRIGINGRMDTLQAAIVLAKLDRFDFEVTQRQKIAAEYTALFKLHCPAVVTPFIETYNSSVFAQYSLLVANRDEVAKRLNGKGIPSAVHYPVPINLQPAYRQISAAESTPISIEIAGKVISMPMSADLNVADQRRIVELVRDVTSA